MTLLTPADLLPEDYAYATASKVGGQSEVRGELRRKRPIQPFL